MSKLKPEILSAIGTAKALALGIYGEDIAAYRYLLLSERAERERERAEFKEMVEEEQGHRELLHQLLQKHFSGSEFVLSADEKQMVESGARSFQITDRKSYHEALRMVVESELLTSQYYDLMEPYIQQKDIKTIFRELAMEGYEHHQRLKQIAEENGVAIA